MNRELKKEEWKEFFETLSKRRYQWNTRVEVLSPDLGDQMLEGGLPFNGITVENKGHIETLHISVGEAADVHQTHKIMAPTKIAFLDADQSHGDIVEIEQEDGTKTLITFVEPKGIIVDFPEFGGVAAVF